MEIICRYCQGVIEVEYVNIVKLGEDYYVVFCPGCGTQNEVYDIYDWFDPDEIEYIEKHNNEDDEGGWEDW